MALDAFLEATVRTATPLAFAALGECMSQRAGVINIGLEGSIIAGALGATIAAGALGVSAGIAGGALAGLAVALLFAFFVVTVRSNQIIAGTAITLLALGLTGTLYRSLYGSEGVLLSIPTSGNTTIPLLAEIPIIGHAFFNQPTLTYALYLVVPLLAWFSARTHAGLAVRAVGEYPDAARAAGISPPLVQTLSIAFAGTMAGIAGATLVVAQTGTFVENMSAGRGFIAIAIVVLGRWSPIGVALAALLFGAAGASQYLAQALGVTGIPYPLFLAIPYLFTLAVLATASSRSTAPAALGKSTQP